MMLMATIGYGSTAARGRNAAAAAQPLSDVSREPERDPRTGVLRVSRGSIQRNRSGSEALLLRGSGLLLLLLLFVLVLIQAEHSLKQIAVLGYVIRVVGVAARAEEPVRERLRILTHL